MNNQQTMGWRLLIVLNTEALTQSDEQADGRLATARLRTMKTRQQFHPSCACSLYRCVGH